MSRKEMIGFRSALKGVDLFLSINRGRYAPLLLLGVLFYPGTLWSQNAGGAEEPATTRFVLDRAPIVVDGRRIGVVRGIRAYPAERRAKEITEAITNYAEDSKLNPDDLRVEETGTASKIVGPTGTIVEIFDFDTDFEGVRINRQLMAEQVLNKIRETIRDYRRDRRPAVLLRNAGYAFALTILALLVFFGARWGYRRFSSWVEQHVPERLDMVEAKSYSLVQAHQVWRILRGAVKIISLLVAIVLGYLYVNSVLGLFPWTRPLALRLFDLVVQPVQTIGSGILGYLPNLVFLILIVIIFRYALKLLRTLFDAVNRKRIAFTGFDSEWAWPTYRLVRLLVLAFGVVIAYPYIPGSDSDAFKGVSIFLGVLASIGSSSIISNVVAGYSMTYRKAFKIGDRVRIGENTGDVTQMRLLVTHLKTTKNEEVVIPNSVVLNNEVINYSTLAKENGLILHTTVGIGYEVPWRQVEAMLLEAARRTPGLITSRVPFVLQTALGDYAIVYELNVYIDDAARMASLYSALHRSIVDVFNEYGVAIMTPSYMADPEEPKVVPKENWYPPPASAPPGAGQA